MSHPYNIPMQHRNKPVDASDSESVVPVDTSRLPEIAAVRPGAFTSRKLPLPQNTRSLLSNSTSTNPIDYNYAINIAPLNLPSAPSPLRTFQAGEQLRRASFDAGYTPSRLTENSTRSHNHDASSTSAPPPLYRSMQLQENPAFASPAPRRYSDQVIPSFRLRAAKWVNAPSPSPSPDTAPSTPNHSDNPPATPSPGLPPTTSQPNHGRSKSEILDITDPHPASLVHRKVKSSDRVSPYPTATVHLAEPGSASEPAPELKKKRKRTVKQRIRWIEVSPGVPLPPTPSSSTSAAILTIGENQGASPPDRKSPPPRRAPPTTPAPKPWKEAQLKIDLRLEPPPPVPVTYYWPTQFEEGPSLPLVPVERLGQNGAVGTPWREVRAPPVSRLENVAGPSTLDARPNRNSQRDQGKGKGKQVYESHSRQTDDGMDVEPWSAGRAGHYPSQERGVVGAGRDIGMLVDDRRTQAVGSSISSASQSRMKWVYAQATTDNDSLERNWGHDTDAMRYTRVHQAGDVTWAYTRFDDQDSGRGLNPADVHSGSIRSWNRSPTGRGGDGREAILHAGVNPPPERHLVKQEVDVDQQVTSALPSDQASSVKRETRENIHPTTHPTPPSRETYRSTQPQQVGHLLAHHTSDYQAPPPFPHFNPTITSPTPIRTQNVHQVQQPAKNTTPPQPNPSSQRLPHSITVPTADHNDPSPISIDINDIPFPQSSSETQTQNTRLEEDQQPPPSNGSDLQEEQEKEDKGVKGTFQPDCEPSPRESPMIETPSESLAVQEMMHCMADIERESEELRQKLSSLPVRSSPKPPRSVTGLDAASADVSSSDFAEYELEEGEIMED